VSGTRPEPATDGTYRPSVVVNLRLRFDERLTNEAPLAATEVRTDPAVGTLPPLGPRPLFAAGEADALTQVFGIVPLEATYELPGFRQAGTFSFKAAFKDLPIAREALHSGVTVLHLPTGAVVGEIRYEATVDEIFDVQVLPGVMRPGILNTRGETHRRALAIPGATFWARPAEEKQATTAPGPPVDAAD